MLGFLKRNRHPSVSSFSRRNIEWHGTEEWHFQAGGLSFAASGPEDIVAFTVVGREEITHVLDDSKDRDVHFGKHGTGLTRINQGYLLRRGDDHRAGESHRLND